MFRCSVNLGVRKHFDVDESFVHNLRIGEYKPKGKPRIDYPTQEDIKLICKALPSYIGRYIWLAAHLPYRRTELLTLQFRDIDWSTNPPQIGLDETKMKGRTRKSPMWSELIVFFKNMKREAEVTFGHAVHNEFVFRGKDGKKSLKYSHLRQKYVDAQIELGFIKNGNHRWRIHDLKKTACKYLLHERRFTQRTVRMFYSGNSDPNVFRKHYNIEDISDYEFCVREALEK